MVLSKIKINKMEEQILKFLKEEYPTVNDLFEAFVEEDDRLYKFGNWVCVDEVGGYEGAGEYYKIVYHFVEHDVYIMFEGFYSSYSGTEFNTFEDSLYIVYPVEVIRTEYKKSKTIKKN